MKAKGIHPECAKWPYHPADKIEAMAESIAQNGLRDPITLDSAGLIVDGKNRFKACEMVDVIPTFVLYDGDEDVRQFILDRNGNRGHITKGQQAMSVAMMYPEPEKGGRGKNSLVNKEFSGVNPGYLSQARTVLAEDPKLAERVRDGGSPLSEAYQTVQSAIAQRRKEKEDLERLKGHPGLSESGWVLEWVIDRRMSANDGLRVLGMDGEDRDRVQTGALSVEEAEVLTRDRNKARIEQLGHVVREVRVYLRGVRLVSGWYVNGGEVSWGEIMEQLTDEERTIMDKEVQRWTK